MTSPEADRHGKKQERRSSRSRGPQSSNPSVPRYMPENDQSQAGALFPRVQHEAGETQYPLQNPRSQDYSTAFARLSLNDWEGCHNFVRQYPSVVNETNLQSKYLDKAVSALTRGENEIAFRYMHRYSIIMMLQDARSTQPLALIIQKDSKTQNQFRTVFARVKENCDKKAGVKPRSTEDTKARHPPRDEDFDAIVTRVKELNIQELRFRPLPSSQWSWFKPGRVIAIKHYIEFDDKSSQEVDNYSSTLVYSNKGTEVIEKTRRMVVVRTRAGFCLAIPINTYGGRGLGKLALRQQNIDAHARIHMKNQPAVWLDREPQSAKRDIVVEPADSSQALHPASRISFERTTNVDYNTPIAKIGTVAPDSLSYLLAYWEAETNRPAGHGQPRPRTSSVVIHGAAEDRHADVQQEGNRHTAQPQAEPRHTAQPQGKGRATEETQETIRPASDRPERSRHADSTQGKKSSHDQGYGRRK